MWHATGKLPSSARITLWHATLNYVAIQKKSPHEKSTATFVAPSLKSTSFKNAISTTPSFFALHAGNH
jgi:hypothetical protein